MNRRVFLIGVAAFAATAITGCKTDSGQDYLGRWRNVDGNAEITIERNGDVFTMTVDPKRSVASKGDTIRKLPAVLTKEGLLEFKDQMGPQLVSIDRNTGQLIAFGMEFAKFDK